MIVADTHALVWWLGAPSRLSTAARKALDADSVGVSAISCLEVALLARRNRIELPSPVSEWLNDMIGLPNTELLAITTAVATTAANLWGSLRDPSDLLIIATALHHGVPLVTKDERIRRAGVVETIW